MSNDKREQACYVIQQITEHGWSDVYVYGQGEDYGDRTIEEAVVETWWLGAAYFPFRELRIVDQDGIRYHPTEDREGRTWKLQPLESVDVTNDVAEDDDPPF